MVRNHHLTANEAAALGSIGDLEEFIRNFARTGPLTSIQNALVHSLQPGEENSMNVPSNPHILLNIFNRYGGLSMDIDQAVTDPTLISMWGATAGPARLRRMFNAGFLDPGESIPPDRLHWENITPLQAAYAATIEQSDRFRTTLPTDGIWKLRFTVFIQVWASGSWNISTVPESELVNRNIPRYLIDGLLRMQAAALERM